MTDLILRSLVVIAAVAQIVMPALVNPFRDGNNPVRASEPSQIEPAGYAFSIWGSIYLLAVGYAIWQLTPSGRTDPMTVRIAPLAIALYVGSSLWLFAAKYGPIWATMPILAVMAACACAILIGAFATPGLSAWRWWSIALPFGLYAGWALCATFVNIAEVAPAYGFNRFGLSTSAYAVLSIAAATVLAAIVLSLCDSEYTFAAAIIWALAAIVVANRQRGSYEAVQIAATLAIFIVIALTAWLKTWARTSSAP